jgi:hypothetical protein
MSVVEILRPAAGVTNAPLGDTRQWWPLPDAPARGPLHRRSEGDEKRTDGPGRGPPGVARGSAR